MLKRTWPIFFGRFGRLLPVQIEAIPLVLNGQNAIVTSPTASGKTEAVVAPLAELLAGDRAKGLLLVYVSPTRALVNDLYERLAEPFSELTLPLAIKTGDRPQFDPSNPQTVLLTTPEALDSLICRSPSVLSSVRFIVLDEIHLVDKTYRGDQLRILLRRLGRLATQDLHHYALSATLSRPEEIAQRYFGNFSVVTIPGSRELEYELFPSLEQALKSARGRRMHKILLFCNRRKEVEEVSGQCRAFWPQDRLVVHHGKLDRSVREESEQFMRECHWGLCVATMTLEIGIDIGDIDVVTLYGAPWSISSLLQRVGRGNRRRGPAVAFGIYRYPEEQSYFRELFELAKAGAIEDEPYVPDLSVVIQQIFSCLYQNPGGLPGDFFLSLFNDYCSPDDVGLILSHLRKLQYVEQRQGKWYASTKVMDMGDMGAIHSNISDARDYKVIDGSTGAVLGEISTAVVEDIFRIAGKAWKVVRIEGSRIYVSPSEGGQAPQFGRGSSKGAFSRLLPPELKHR
jgi:ATP-dependent Lhr-like helicase